MELIRGIHNIQPYHQGCVLTIGNFDGVHLGHQEVLKKVLAKAKELNLPAVVMIFEPQPREFFAGNSAPARLTRLRDKCVQLEKLGVERLLCINFNAHFAEMAPNDFIQHLLVERLGVKFLVVGDDFQFGRQRAGNFSTLKQAGEQFGFEVASTQSFRLLDKRISSTAIRHALANSDLSTAEQMLDRTYSISGRIAHGRKLGRTIGFPTANIPLKRRVSPVSGVFAVNILGLGDKPLNGVANIGSRPTVNGLRQQLEVHIFDFNEDLYGRQIEVQLRYKLRDEIKFASFDDLKDQIVKDAQEARDWLSSH
ncbi:bifunctional riboflavin kinase/FAD synthetase [Vibrio sp. SS-MA-C1-2]|uniref:bifunctional riboflavin kinase/FAD synthetase n=1 Tax=Vibrio sp. SS-MA-C1-2 TaxID=2908646 RepID=UPI001F018399|nr:bifunctional riboflavin kinase/FAD synthetase [Vibrio sp. SS-MA-C1-2]UJF19685.1 bifunctional riboflavin kinase/FAD synthetase [Vibrio sp. SS-MA-C1-2]